VGPHTTAHSLSFDRDPLRAHGEVTRASGLACRRGCAAGREVVVRAAVFAACALLAASGGCVGSAPVALAPPSVPLAPQAALPSLAMPEPQPEPSVVAGASPTVPTPTWSELFSAYMAPGTEGGCGRAGRCHARQMADPTSAYGWLKQRGYIAGTDSAIASNANSCLRWFGGNMPPGGQANPKAVADLAAWVAGRAPQN
jgi:hypothetical protein